jgi:hypothetical protein
MFAMAACDACENVGLLMMFSNEPFSPVPELTRMFSVTKFSLLGAGLAFAAVGGLFAFAVRFFGPTGKTRSGAAHVTGSWQ